MNFFHFFVQKSTRGFARVATILTGTALNTTLDLDALFAGIVEIILKMGTYVGGALAVGGVLQLILSYYNDQPEGKASALRVIVVGGALMGMRGLLQIVGLI